MKSQTIIIYPGKFILLMMPISISRRFLYSSCKFSGTNFSLSSRPFLHSCSKNTASFLKLYLFSGSGRVKFLSLAHSRVNLKFGGVGLPSLISRLHLSTISWVFSITSGMSKNSSFICSLLLTKNSWTLCRRRFGSSRVLFIAMHMKTSCAAALSLKV